MRKHPLFLALALAVIAGGALAANQVATDAFRKILAVELFSSNAAFGVSGNPFYAILNAGSALIGHVNVDAQTGNGCTAYHLADGTAATTNSTNIKGSAGNLCDLTPINTTTTIYYLKLYDSASAPTCSSATNLKHVYPIPPAGTAGQAGGFMRPVGQGESYANGIGFCVTASGADISNDSAATGIYIEASYK